MRAKVGRKIGLISDGVLPKSKFLIDFFKFPDMPNEAYVVCKDKDFPEKDRLLRH